jgi:nitrogen regulatory protein P-II 2
MTDDTSTNHLRLLTIVAESVLEDRLVRDVLAAGATGYTATRAHGQGSRETRASALAGNVRIEVVLDAATERALLALLERDYFPNYAVIAWAQSVDVVRGAKYTRSL